jgi:HNH endonuclease
MSAAIVKTVRKCIYCGGEVTKERRGEHIVPEAIGGKCTLKEVAGKSVCARCNNGVLSILDKELCNRSHLSVIASQEIEANLWQVWDIDHSARELLVEAKPYWEGEELKSLVCHPQMIFEKEGPQIRCDVEEMERFGKDRLLNVMVRAVQGAYERYSAGKKGVLHFERVRNDLSTRNYRLPPRVHVPRSLEEIEANLKDQSFVFRYLTPEDRTFALEKMAHLTLDNKGDFNRSAQFVGSQNPSISIYFDLGLVVRDMMKIAVNLLAAYCSKTAVNCDTFPDVTRLILGKRHPHPLHIAGNGFVHAQDVEELARPGCHSFRITTLGNEWIIYMSFFGGRIGSAVSFPGPNREEWNTMEIVAPIHSKNWTITTSQLYLPLRVRFEWQNHEAITPSLKLQYAQARMLAEEAPPRKY